MVFIVVTLLTTMLYFLDYQRWTGQQMYLYLYFVFLTGKDLKVRLSNVSNLWFWFGINPVSNTLFLNCWHKRMPSCCSVAHSFTPAVNSNTNLCAWMTLTIFKPAYWMRIQSLIHRRTLTCEENNEIKWITWLRRLTGYRRARLCAFTSFIYVVAALLALFHLNKTRWIPHIRPCLCWLWHGAWTCFLTRSKDWGTVRETCLCVSATILKGVRSLLNIAIPLLPIFNNYLEEAVLQVRVYLWQK